MTRGMLLCAFLLMLVGHHEVEMVPTISISPPGVGVLGNNRHNVTCSYSTQASEPVSYLQMIQIVNGAQTLLVGLYPGMGSAPVWELSAPSEIKARAVLTQPSGATSLQINYNNTLCSDEKKYLCKVTYLSGGNSLDQTNITTQLTVEASPGPLNMAVVPESQSVTENTTLIFTCTGMVGKPAGQIEWYLYKGGLFENYTSQADLQVNTITPSNCTYDGRRSIKVNMTRMEQGAFMVCRVYHPTQGSNSPIEDCTDATFCHKGNNISVFYPVSVTVSPTTVPPVYQGSRVTVTCSAEGFPVPSLQWYRASNMTAPLSTSNTLTLLDVSLDDKDEYICVGINSDTQGNKLNDSKMVLITVLPTTTPPPTTTSTKTITSSTAPATATGGVSSPQEDSGVNKSAIIIGVVVPVAVIIIIILIIAIVMCRKRSAKKPPVEEPPEKPFNNHTRINTVASQPDLVTSDKHYPAYDNSKAFVNEDGLTYAQLQLDNKPRSRRPLALDDTHTDYSDISMPQV